MSINQKSKAIPSTTTCTKFFAQNFSVQISLRITPSTVNLEKKRKVQIKEQNNLLTPPSLSLSLSLSSHHSPPLPREKKNDDRSFNVTQLNSSQFYHTAIQYKKTRLVRNKWIQNRSKKGSFLHLN